MHRKDEPNLTTFSIDSNIVQEFKKLKRISDYHDAEFKNDETSKNKIQLGILVKENIYFKTKTPLQVGKILATFRFIKKEDSFEQYSKKTIDLEEFTEMRKVISCIEDRKNIVEFVDRYLGYDEYGELQKKDLKDILTFVIGGEGKTAEIILMTIWCWLEKSGVIINDILRRNHMQLLYERNKVLYYFIISLVFGTNDTSALDLAQEILV